MGYRSVSVFATEGVRGSKRGLEEVPVPISRDNVVVGMCSARCWSTGRSKHVQRRRMANEMGCREGW